MSSDGSFESNEHVIEMKTADSVVLSLFMKITQQTIAGLRAKHCNKSKPENLTRWIGIFGTAIQTLQQCL